MKERVYNLFCSMETRKRFFTFTIFILALAYGFSVTIIGPLIPSLVGDFGIRVSAAGLLLTLQSIGGIIAILASGILIDRTDNRSLSQSFS